MLRIHYYDHIHRINDKTTQTNHMFNFLCIVICKQCYSQLVLMIFPGTLHYSGSVHVTPTRQQRQFSYSEYNTCLTECFKLLQLIFGFEQSSFNYEKTSITPLIINQSHSGSTLDDCHLHFCQLILIHAEMTSPLSNNVTLKLSK